jgi:hypothetical protein
VCVIGEGRNHSTITANDSLSGPAYECRAGRSSEGVCQGKQWHGLDSPYLYLSTDKHIVNPSVQFFPMFANGFHNQSLRIGRKHGKDEVLKQQQFAHKRTYSLEICCKITKNF